MIDYIGWVGSALLVLGMFFLGEKSRTGFVFAGIGEALWTYKSYATEQFDLLVICVIFTLLYAFNWWKWRPSALQS